MFTPVFLSASPLVHRNNDSFLGCVWGVIALPPTGFVDVFASFAAPTSLSLSSSISYDPVSSEWENRMSLTEKWKDSPIVSLVAACIAIGSGIFGVVEYFGAQKVDRINQSHENEIHELKAQLASVQMELVDEDAIDVRSLVLKTGDRQTIPDESKFFKTDSFYAQKNSSDWSYSEQTERSYYQQSGVAEHLDSAALNAAGGNRIHVWRSGKPVQIQQGAETIQVGMMVTVQRLDDQALARSMGLGTDNQAVAVPEKPGLKSIFQNAGAQKVIKEDSSTRVAYQAFQFDRAGKFFQIMSFLSLSSSLQSPQVNYSLNRVQKIGDTVYAQATTSLDYVRVNETMQERFYLHSEELYIADGSEIYLVKMVVPSADPVVNVGQRSKLVSWLQRFRIIR